jgi:hypothetical protein
MSEHIAVLSSVAITPDEFAAFLTEIGGVVDPEYNDQGRISRQNRHVWIYLSPEELADVIEKREDVIVQKLGKMPKTNVIVDISREAQSEELALEFARAFAARWPSIVNNLNGKLFSLEELRRLPATGEGLLY